MRPDEVDPAAFITVPVRQRVLSEPSGEDDVKGAFLGRYPSASFHQDYVTTTLSKTI